MSPEEEILPPPTVWGDCSISLIKEPLLQQSSLGVIRAAVVYLLLSWHSTAGHCSICQPQALLKLVLFISLNSAVHDSALSLFSCIPSSLLDPFATCFLLDTTIFSQEPPSPIRYHLVPLGIADTLLGTTASTWIGDHDAVLSCAKAPWHSMGENTLLLCVLYLVTGHCNHDAVPQCSTQ